MISITPGFENLQEGSRTLGFVCKEVVNLGDRAVESDDIDAMIGSIQDQVLAHDGQANKAEVSSGSMVSKLSLSLCAEASARARRYQLQQGALCSMG
jgi:hypothetical protein